MEADQAKLNRVIDRLVDNMREQVGRLDSLAETLDDQHGVIEAVRGLPLNQAQASRLSAAADQLDAARRRCGLLPGRIAVSGEVGARDDRNFPQRP